MNSRSILAGLLFAIPLFVTAGVSYRAHLRNPYSDPAGSVGALFRAASLADLAGIQRASEASFYQAFVSHFGAIYRERVNQIYAYVYRLGFPEWRRLASLARYLASDYYETLHNRIQALGREAFGRLALDERMSLIQDRVRFEKFLFEEGVKSLPPEDRRRIEDPEAFRTRRDRARFVEREGWSLLPTADREALGSAAALAQEDTMEKLAFIDRVGLGLLDKRLREEIAGIPRSELGDAARFDFKYGQPLAVNFLRAAKIPSLRPETCGFPRADTHGSLLKGLVARCSVTVRPTEAARPIELTIWLQKRRFDWLVEAVEPALYEIPW